MGEELFHSLIAKIDSISDKIPECVYMKICDDLKELYKILDIKSVTKSEIADVAPAVSAANGYWLRQSERRTEPVYASSRNYSNMEDLIRSMGYAQDS